MGIYHGTGEFTDEKKVWKNAKNNQSIQVYRYPKASPRFINLSKEIIDQYQIEIIEPGEYIFIRFYFSEINVGTEDIPINYKVTYGPTWFDSDDCKGSNGSFSISKFYTYFNTNNNEFEIYSISKKNYTTKYNSNSKFELNNSFFHETTLNVILCKNDSERYLYFYLEFYKKSLSIRPTKTLEFTHKSNIEKIPQSIKAKLKMGPPIKNIEIGLGMLGPDVPPPPPNQPPGAEAMGGGCGYRLPPRPQ